MDKTRDVKEIQFSSSQVVLLFLVIIVVGVFIFLLGVSVGKKHASLARETDEAIQAAYQPVKKKIPTVSGEKPSLPQETEASKKTPEKAPTVSQTPPSPSTPLEPSKTAIKTIPPSAPQTKPLGPAVSKTPPKPAAAPSEQKGLFYVQLGAYDDKQTAINLSDDLRRSGFPTVVLEPFSTDKIPYYRVRVGGYKTREEAERTAVRLTTFFQRAIDYWIVKD